LQITFADFTWNKLRIEIHRIKHLSLVFSHINHNSSECWIYRWFCLSQCLEYFDVDSSRRFTFCYSTKFQRWFIKHEIDSTFWNRIVYFHSSPCSNLLFKMLLGLQIIFIDFIWDKFRTDMHRGKCILILFFS
jgi:hypothetical protein